VEWELTRVVYTSSKYKGRFWNTNQKDYALVVADMIDRATTYSTRINEGFRDSRDQVSGCTIQQIEDVLEDTSLWEDWKNQLSKKIDK
jgi:hypothetical protein